MDAYLFDQQEFFQAVAQSGARALLIGRRALIALGLPVMTADYDFWVHPDDAAAFNQALAPLGLSPNRTLAEARSIGRYVLENDVRVDVLIARGMPTIDGVRVLFDDVWTRRVPIEAAPGIHIAMPCLDDLIATKRFGARPKDAEDVRRLLELKQRVKP
jgi:hypothetical protein